MGDLVVKHYIVQKISTLCVLLGCMLAPMGAHAVQGELWDTFGGASSAKSSSFMMDDALVVFPTEAMSDSFLLLPAGTGQLVHDEPAVIIPTTPVSSDRGSGGSRPSVLEEREVVKEEAEKSNSLKPREEESIRNNDSVEKEEESSAENTSNKEPKEEKGNLDEKEPAKKEKEVILPAKEETNSSVEVIAKPEEETLLHGVASQEEGRDVLEMQQREQRVYFSEEKLFPICPFPLVDEYVFAMSSVHCALLPSLHAASPAVEISYLFTHTTTRGLAWLAFFAFALWVLYSLYYFDSLSKRI